MAVESHSSGCPDTSLIPNLKLLPLTVLRGSVEVFTGGVAGYPRIRFAVSIDEFSSPSHDTISC